MNLDKQQFTIVEQAESGSMLSFEKKSTKINDVFFAKWPDRAIFVSM